MWNDYKKMEFMKSCSLKEKGYLKQQQIFVSKPYFQKKINKEHHFP